MFLNHVCMPLCDVVMVYLEQAEKKKASDGAYNITMSH